MCKTSLDAVVLAPLLLLERSKGWKRRGLALLYLLIALTAGVFAWREVSLWGLPNAPEPFDLAKYGRINVPDADNAMVAYREVFARFGDLGEKRYQPAGTKAWDVTDWSAADPEVRRWAEDHRQALEAWLPANDRTDSLLVQPEALRIRTLLRPVQSLRHYVRLALLEGSRLEQSGDLAAAWKMYRAALRASRHAGRHGGSIQRFIGNRFLRDSRARIEAWTDNPAVTVELLRQAIGDVETCRAMTSPASEVVRAEYFSARDAISDIDMWPNLTDAGPYSRTEWSNQYAAGRWARRFLRRELERSGRILRLITAGYLAQCDRPRAVRPRLLFPEAMIYDDDPQTPPAVRAISPNALESWWRGSVLHEISPFSQMVQAHLESEPPEFDDLTLKMAERAFAIEHGRPPKTYGELVGPYLNALPEGINATDLVHPESE